MTWQEELRQLDSALAGGELAANEYRKRRDEILATASSAQPPSAVLGPPTGPRPAITPDGNGTDNSGDNGEVTQIVNTSETVPSNEADATQIISDPTKGEQQPQQQAVNQQDAGERTQVITTPDERTAPALPQQQSPWAAHRPDQNGPAGPFPQPAQPMLPAPTVTPMDAQSLFTSNKPPRGGGSKPWLIALVLIVVLAVAGGAVWWFALRDDNSATTADPAPTSEQQPTEEEPPPPVDIATIDLPGEPVKNIGEMDIVKAGELKVIAPAEAALLADAGVGPLVYSGAAEGNYRFLLYSYESDDVDQAKQLTDSVAGVQEQIGLKEATVDGVVDGVQVTQLTNKSAAVIRALYTYGDTTIQLAVLQVPAGDAGELGTQFTAALKAVTDAAPPTK